MYYLGKFRKARKVIEGISNKVGQGMGTYNIKYEE